MGGTEVSRKAGFMVFALAVAVSGCATSQVSETDRLHARSAYEQGLNALTARDLSGAMTSLRQATILDPTAPVYRNALGLVYLQLGRPELALPELQRATQLDADYAEAWLNTGVAFADLQRWDEAVAAYTRAIASPRLITPDTAHHDLGVALFNLNRFPEAERELRYAITLNPQLGASYYYLGLVLATQHRNEEAKMAFRRARELAPESPFAQGALERLKALGDGG